mmetsp:Transcript_27768/g.45804  ORF Transcript_27768/g.45804 Transcript_27768/m.45804 type:complete len:931 (+) Transcript_27768:251-3043(+)
MSLAQTTAPDNDLSLWGLDELLDEPAPALQQSTQTVVVEPPRKKHRANTTTSTTAKHVSAAERKQNSSSSSTACVGAPPPATTTTTATTTHTPTRPALPATHTTQNEECGAIDLTFLRQRQSKVLSADEVVSVLHLSALRDEYASVTTERYRNICDYFGDEVVRCYAGLTRYDSAQRLQTAMDALQSLYRDNGKTLCSAYAQQQSEHVKNQLKQRHKMLSELTDHYRSFCEYAHYHVADNVELKRRIAAQHQRFQRQRVHDSEFAYHAGLTDNTWLNPVSMAMARGHSLSRAHAKTLTRLKFHDRADGDHVHRAAGDDDNDAYTGDHEQSLLGGSGACPPKLGAMHAYRTNSNEHLGRFNDNMRILYGTDATPKFDTRNLRYRAHLLQEHFTDFHRLGSGVYGCVFRARTKRTNVTVAIKIVSLLKPEQSIDKEYQKHMQQQQQRGTAKTASTSTAENVCCPFMTAEGVPLTVVREINALKQLNHVNVTRLYDVLINDSRDRNEIDDEELRKVIYKRYDFGGAQSKRWTFHLVQEYVPNELGALIGNLREIHFECIRRAGNVDDHTATTKPHPQQHSNVEGYRLTPQQMQKDIKWFTQAHIKSMMHDLLSGLQFLLLNKYIHRDLKPQNLLLTDEGRVKIADFGLSRAHYLADGEMLTNGGHVVTRYYRAPEILLFQSDKRSVYSFASDMFSVGCIFGELIQGRPVFRGEDDFTQLYWIQHKCGAMTADTIPGWQQYVHANGAKIEQYTAKRQIAAKYEGGARPHIVTETEKFTPTWSSHAQNSAIDLLTKMLTYDASKRITPSEALQHPWFMLSPSMEAPKKFIQEIRRAKKQSHSDLQKTQQQHKQQQLLKQKQNSLPPPQTQAQARRQQQQQQQPYHAHRRPYTHGHAPQSMNNLHHAGPPPPRHSHSRHGGNRRHAQQQRRVSIHH